MCDISRGADLMSMLAVPRANHDLGHCARQGTLSWTEYFTDRPAFNRIGKQFSINNASINRLRRAMGCPALSRCCVAQ
jgi:hypothetical protein